MTRPRLRDHGITIGTLPTGPFNAITDVPDVWVGHTTLVHDIPRVARTGVTVVVPRAGHIHENSVFAGFHSFNGCGEMTGISWIEESGLLMSPIALTTTQVGLVKGHGPAPAPAGCCAIHGPGAGSARIRSI